MITFFVFLFFSTTFLNKVVAFDESKSIRELKKDIVTLNQAEINLENKYKSFLKDYKIDFYLRNNLSHTDNENLKNIASKFLKENLDLELKLSRLTKEEDILKVSNDLLNLRKELYKSLIPYIDSKNYKKYLNFIEINLKNFIEKNNLYLAKLKTKNNYNKKVDNLEKKIQENKETLNLEVKNLIEEKFNEKINSLLDSPSFSKLSNSNKIKVLQKVIDNLSLKIETFKWNLNYNSIYIESDLKKLEIYKTMLKKLQEIAYELK